MCNSGIGKDWNGYHYAAIGSDNTPPEQLNKLEELATLLSQYKFTLRLAKQDKPVYRHLLAGHQAGRNGNVAIQYNGATSSYEANMYIKQFLTSWEWFSTNIHSKNLLGSKAQLLLGKHLISPVLFLLCYLPDTNVWGHKTTIAVANKNDIPIINLADEKLAHMAAETIFTLYVLPIAQAQLNKVLQLKDETLVKAVS